jgi:nucleotide-binding universal stress UspA family protein
MQIRKILVPAELTRLSDIATEYAVGLARQLNLEEVILLNIIIPANVQTTSTAGEHLNTSVDIAQQLNMTMLESHREILEKHALKHSTPEVKVKPVARTNSSKSNINQYMREYGANLLVAGSQDKFSFLEILFGSATEKMIRKIDYPMIVLTSMPVHSEIRKIALAIDVELENEDHEGIDDVIDFAGILNAQLQLVYVKTNDNVNATDVIERLQQLAKNKNIRNYSINVVDNYSLEHGLKGFVRNYDPDLVAVLNNGKGKLHNLIYGSKTGELIKEIDIPVFVAKCK